MLQYSQIFLDKKAQSFLTRINEFLLTVNMVIIFIRAFFIMPIFYGLTHTIV